MPKITTAAGPSGAGAPAAATTFTREDGVEVPVLPLCYGPGAVNGYVWTTDANGNGSWQVAPGAGSSLSQLTRVLFTVPSSNATHTALANEITSVDTTSYSGIVYLPNAPAASTLNAVKMIILGSTNTVTITCQGSDVINKTGGGTTQSLTLSSQGSLLCYNSGIWTILSDDLPLTQLETLFLQPANNLSDLASASTARTNLGLGTAATLASSAVAQTANNLSDVASASTALSNLGGLPKAGGTMSGAIAMGSNKVTGLTNGSASTDAAAYGQTLGGGNLSPLTTEGDLIIANATPAPARLAIGSAGQSLQVSSGLPAWGMGITLLATTGTTGYTLVNGTGNILTWTAPNDGALHRVLLIATLYVSSAESGGSINMGFTFPSGTSSGTPQVLAGGLSTGAKFPSATTFLVEAGTTVTLQQANALSGGAATLWAELWGS